MIGDPPSNAPRGDPDAPRVGPDVGAAAAAPVSVAPATLDTPAARPADLGFGGFSGGTSGSEEWPLIRAWRPHATSVVAEIHTIRHGNSAKIAHGWKFSPQYSMTNVGWSPEGTRICTTSHDQTARIFDAKAGRQMLGLEHEDYVNFATFTPNGRMLITSSRDGGVRIVDATTRAEWGKFQHEKAVLMAAITPDSKRLATASDFRARIFNLEWQKREVETPPASAIASRRESRRASKEAAQEAAAAASTEVVINDPLGLLGGDSDDGTPRAKKPEEPIRDPKEWCFNTSVEPFIIKAEAPVMSANFNHDGNLLCTACLDGTARIFDVRPRAEEEMDERELEAMAKAKAKAKGEPAPKSKLHDAPMTPAQKALAKRRAAKEKKKKKADEDLAPTFGAEVQCVNHPDQVVHAIFNPEGRRLASCGRDKSIRLWDVETGTDLLMFQHGNWINNIDFCHDTSLLCSACDDGVVRIYDLKVGRRELVAINTGVPVSAARFSPEGRRVAAALRDGRAMVYGIPR